MLYGRVQNAKKRFKYSEKFPKQSLKACTWFGARGRQPFHKPYNDGPLNCIYNYCEVCCD